MRKTFADCLTVHFFFFNFPHWHIVCRKIQYRDMQIQLKRQANWKFNQWARTISLFAIRSTQWNLCFRTKKKKKMKLDDTIRAQQSAQCHNRNMVITTHYRNHLNRISSEWQQVTIQLLVTANMNIYDWTKFFSDQVTYESISCCELYRYFYVANQFNHIKKKTLSAHVAFVMDFNWFLIFIQSKLPANDFWYNCKPFQCETIAIQCKI